MPDHMHLVIELPDGVTSGKIMRFIKARFARRWNHRLRTDGSVWQARFHERVLTSDRALLAAVDYVHSNPVAAGLAESTEDYVLSSARAWGERSQAELASYERATEALKRLEASLDVRPAPA